MLLADRSENVAEQRHAREILDRKKPGAQAVVDVVGVVGNVVGNSRELRLGVGKAPQLEVLRPVMKRGVSARYLGLPSRSVSGPLCLTSPSSVSQARFNPSKSR